MSNRFAPFIEDEQENKREYLRLPRSYRIQAREMVFPIAKDPLIDGESRDISRGGLCVESDVFLPEGTRLHVTVHIPLLNKFHSGFFKVYENDAEQYFQAVADVTWCRPVDDRHLLGLVFINVDEDIAKAINKLVSEAFRGLK